MHPTMTGLCHSLFSSLPNLVQCSFQLQKQVMLDTKWEKGESRSDLITSPDTVVETFLVHSIKVTFLPNVCNLFSRQLGLDLVPRKEYAMVDPEDISITELYRLVGGQNVRLLPHC